MVKVILRFSLLIIIFALVKFAYNGINYLRTKELFEIYKHWIFNDNYNSKCLQSKQEVLSLFKKANVKDHVLMISQSIQNDRVCDTPVSVFEAFPLKNESVIVNTIGIFEETIGCFKFRMFQAINPIYWVEVIVFFPKYLLNYFNIDINNAVSKILNLVLTAIWWLLCLILTCFKSEIINSLQTFIQKLA